MECGKKKSFNLVWQCLQLLSRFLAKGHLPRVSRQSRLSANDKGDSDMIPGLYTDFLVFTLQPRKSPKNLSQ
jgi:hypothetical protein